MIVQIIGWFCLGFGASGFVIAGFSKDRQSTRDTVRTAALLLIAAAICFK